MYITLYTTFHVNLCSHSVRVNADIDFLLPRQIWFLVEIHVNESNACLKKTKTKQNKKLYYQGVENHGGLSIDKLHDSFQLNESLLKSCAFPAFFTSFIVITQLPCVLLGLPES